MADLESQKIRKTKISFKLIVLDILLVILERLTMWLLLSYPSFVHFFCSTGFTPLRLHISVSYGYLTEDLTSVALGEYYLLLLIERFVSFAAIYLCWPTNFWCIVVVSCSAISTICSATIARGTYFISLENRKEKQKKKDYGSSSPNPDSPPSYDPPLHVRDGDLSDDPAHASSSSSANRRGDRQKRVIPWAEEEHRMFLIGLEKLGKGDWRGIARNYVKTRTPTQVASHAHRYFTRQSTSSSSDPPHMPEEQALLLGSSMVA